MTSSYKSHFRAYFGISASQSHTVTSRHVTIVIYITFISRIQFDMTKSIDIRFIIVQTVILVMLSNQAVMTIRGAQYNILAQR